MLQSSLINYSFKKKRWKMEMEDRHKVGLKV